MARLVELHRNHIPIEVIQHQAVDRKRQEADAIRSAVAMQADVADEAQVRAYVERCISEFGSIHGIYANAGVGGGGKPMLELTIEDWQRTLGVNTIGVFLAVKHTVPHLVAQGQGAIVCTASVAGLRANAGGVDYSASKD